MAKQAVCEHCHTVAKPTWGARGSCLMEVVLWLMLIVPGIIYSVWRVTTIRKLCPACGSSDLVPLESPRGRQLRGL